ncbi:MAG: oligopeptide transport system ATP-binding protein [Solirubrobacteraceae bacterium]
MGDGGVETVAAPAVLEVRNVVKRYASRRQGLGSRAADVVAVDDVSFDLRPGETLALVGESGCGKTTTASIAARLETPDTGTVRFRGEDVFAMGRARAKRFRRELQVVFQDPYASLNPRMTVGAIVSEGWRIHGDVVPARERAARVGDLLALVGLRPETADRYPHQFSGGQRQRIGIARALSLSPEVIVCDEPVSALDVSVQAQIINLLGRLQAEFGLAYLFISHDLGVVRHLADRVAVMHRGVLVEVGDKRQVYELPQHEYTRRLLAAAPRLDRRRPPRTAG